MNARPAGFGALLKALFVPIALAVAAMFPTVPLAQTATVTQLTGTFGTGARPAGFYEVSGTFVCDLSGSAPHYWCNGTIDFDERDENCTNSFHSTGSLQLEGLDPARNGPFHAYLMVRAPDYNVTKLPDGSCTYALTGPIQYEKQISGTWYGTGGTFQFPLDWDSNGNLIQISGSITAAREQPLPVFPMTVSSVINASTASVSADFNYRPQDVGTTGSVYVFAVAPSTIVKNGQDAKAMRIGLAKGAAAKADAPVACVLAQLTKAGDMVAVTADQLEAYLTGVFSAQGASVAILNGVPTVTVAGATFYVGYGASGTTMIDTGINRSAVTVPGSLVCDPQPPQTGWWWNPLEDGRGFSLEVRGNNIFFAAFLYDVSGRSTWYVSTGPVSLDGSYYRGDLLSARGGQTLGGAYSRFPDLTSVGPITITFNNASTGTIVWPGGTVPIQRFNIVPNGLNLAPVTGQPENGWWWDEKEAGRGFYMEWQGGNLDIAGYMYDDAGNSVWYLTTGPIGGAENARHFTGNWWTFGGGQTLTGPWKPNTRLSDNVAPVTIQFNGADKATMTLPNGRTANLYRHRF
jgi:hypothetical protein